MTRRAVRTGLALLAALLVGCGSDASVQGGGATETDNSIHILATTANGTPMPGARVLLVRTDTWLRDVAATGTPTTIALATDTSGRLRLDSLPSGEWSAQLETPSEACSVPLKRDTATMLLKLQSLTKVGVAITGRTEASLMAVGTTWRSMTDSDGRSWLLLPPGRRSLVADLDTALAEAAVVSVVSGQDLDTTVTVVPRRILLDDFSSGDGRTSLSRYTGMGDWFVNAWGTQIYSDADPQGASFEGALSMRYTAPDTNAAALAGIVFADDRGFRSMDFSRMDSICFDVRGNGNVDLYFIEYAVDRSWKLSANSRLEGLSTDWTRRCVAAGSLQDHWAEVKTTANTIAFLARRGDLLEVRDMELWGIPLSDLSR